LDRLLGSDKGNKPLDLSQQKIIENRGVFFVAQNVVLSHHVSPPSHHVLTTKTPRENTLFL
jgi:hypothetical protein